MTSFAECVYSKPLFFLPYLLIRLLYDNTFLFWIGVPVLWWLRANYENTLKENYVDEGIHEEHRTVKVVVYKILLLISFGIFGVLTATYSYSLENMFDLNYKISNTYIFCQRTYNNVSDFLLSNIPEICQERQYVRYYGSGGIIYTFMYQDPIYSLDNYSSVDVAEFNKSSFSGICSN